MATGSYTNKGQLVDVSSTTVCTGLTDYPMSIRYATGGLMNGSPLICGGYGSPTASPGSNSDQSACYIYNNESHQWQLHANMNNKRSSTASAMLSNGLWVTGGYQSGVGNLASTEIVKPDGTVIDGQDLPVATIGHCMVTMDNGHVAILGVSSQHKSLHIFNPSTNTYTTGPSMVFDRYSAGCTLFYSQKHG